MATRDLSGLIRVLRQYTFVLAAVLTVALLIANLAWEKGGFGLTAQLANLAPSAIAAMASTPSIISGGGGFDLSISPVMTFIGGVIAVWLIPHGLGGAALVPIVLLIGLGVGAINGLIIMILRVPPVVATLSVYFVFIGVDLLLLPSPAEVSGKSWIGHLGNSVGPIPGALFTIGFPLLLWLILGLTPYRRTLLAVGSNAAAAFSAGVQVGPIRVVAYALGGLFAAVGGLAATALQGTADATTATTFTLLAVAAVALGGTPLAGGRGGLVGPVLGAASIYLLGNLLLIAQVNPSWLQVIYGIVLVIAVVITGGITSGRRPVRT